MGEKIPTLYNLKEHFACVIYKVEKQTNKNFWFWTHTKIPRVLAFLWKVGICFLHGGMSRFQSSVSLGRLFFFFVSSSFFEKWKGDGLDHKLRLKRIRKFFYTELTM